MMGERSRDRLDISELRTRLSGNLEEAEAVWSRTEGGKMGTSEAVVHREGCPASVISGSARPGLTENRLV